MAVQIEQTLNTNTTGTQAQLESLAAFLSDWSESSLASTPIPTPASYENEYSNSIHRPYSPHISAAPAPALPPRSLRRRYEYIVATETETDDAGAMDSLVIASLRLREQHSNFHHGQLLQYRQHEAITTSNNNTSPSCTRAALLHKEISARSVGAGFQSAPLPPLPFSPVGARPIDTDTE